MSDGLNEEDAQMSKLSKDGARLLWAVIALVGVGLIVWAFSGLLPWIGSKDKTPMGPHQLADLALKSMQYLQALTTAVFGGSILVFGQRLLQRGRVQDNNQDNQLRQFSVAVGFLMLALSLGTGFVGIEAVIEAGYQQVVLEKVGSMRWLRILQAAFLALGVFIVGWVLISDTTRGQEGARPEGTTER